MSIVRPTYRPANIGAPIDLSTSNRRDPLQEYFKSRGVERKKSPIQIDEPEPIEERRSSEERIPQGEYVKAQVRGLEEREVRPHLRPDARVRNPSQALVDPSGFSQYYDMLEQIHNRGQHALQKEEVKSANRQQSRLQEILSRQIPQMGGTTLNYTGPGPRQFAKARRNTAQLGMLGSVQPYVRGAAQEISGLFGYNNIGGYATSGHIKGSDHYTGKALDVMGGGYNVVNHALQNSGRLRVKYIIYNRTYWEPGKKPKRYTGSNPHTGHVHLSFY